MSTFDPKALSDDDLADVIRWIDGKQYPERLEQAKAEFARRQAAGALHLPSEQERLAGRGGWLVLVGIHLAASAIVLTISVGRIMLQLVAAQGAVEVLASLVGLAVEAAFLLACLISLALFFSDSRYFVYVFVALQALFLAVALLGYLAGVPRESLIGDSVDPGRHLLLATLRSGLLASYVITSERVRNTFTAG